MRTRPDTIRSLQIDDGEVRIDEQGFLVDPEEWSEAFAEKIARDQDVKLTDTHWRVLRFMRDFLAEHGVAPDARFVFRFLDDLEPSEAEVGTRSGDRGRARFFDLFPYGYVGQACRMAGMRQPRAWSTG